MEEGVGERRPGPFRVLEGLRASSPRPPLPLPTLWGGEEGDGTVPMLSIQKCSGGKSGPFEPAEGHTRARLRSQGNRQISERRETRFAFFRYLVGRDALPFLPLLFRDFPYSPPPYPPPSLPTQWAGEGGRGRWGSMENLSYLFLSLPYPPSKRGRGQGKIKNTVKGEKRGGMGVVR